ncbi:MAG: CAP domain-containing protein [Cyanobacteriota bacterium]|jgi:uncharacterized protein YkwD
MTLTKTMKNAKVKNENNTDNGRNTASLTVQADRTVGGLLIPDVTQFKTAIQPATVALALRRRSVREDGSDNLVYTFTRTGPSNRVLRVHYRVSGTATLGQDYSGITTSGRLKTVTFAAGASTARVVVNPTTDVAIEPHETVALTLTSGSDYRISTRGAVSGSIRNDDLPSYAVSPSVTTINEGESLTSTVSTTGVTKGTRLYWALAGTGLQGADFAAGALSGSARVGRNGRFSFSHTLRNDASSEGDETLTILLYADAAHRRQVGAPVSVTIRDTSRAPANQFDPVLIRESTRINASITSQNEVDRYEIDVVSGAILTASLSSDNRSLYPLIHLKGVDGTLLKNPIAYNGDTASLGMVDLVTGKAILEVKTQIGATGNYTLNLAIATRAAIKNEVIQLTNVERQKAGLAPLTPNSLLERAAEAHVQDMDASDRYLAHTGSNGSTPVDRIQATGYKAAWVDLGNGSLRTISSENAASGYASASDVVQAWMGSSGHRAAILDPATKEIGVGFELDNETNTTYWLQNFGYPWSAGMTPWF